MSTFPTKPLQDTTASFVFVQSNFSSQPNKIKGRKGQGEEEEGKLSPPQKLREVGLQLYKRGIKILLSPHPNKLQACQWLFRADVTF